MTSALDALARLKAGNLRFSTDAQERGASLSSTARSELAKGQAPFAVVLGCSDSRVTPELLFDQDLGELFTVRVAGHVVAAPVLESVEFAVEQLGAKLVVVLGHTGCAAVSATLAEVQTPGTPAAEKLSAVIHHIKPPVEAVISLSPKRPFTEAEQGALMHASVRANIRHSACQLREDSAVISALVESGEVLVVGAEYSLETGVVEFIDGLPD
jgi:carbonic anhydrase